MIFYAGVMEVVQGSYWIPVGEAQNQNLDKILIW